MWVDQSPAQHAATDLAVELGLQQQRARLHDFSLQRRTLHIACLLRLSRPDPAMPATAHTVSTHRQQLSCVQPASSCSPRVLCGERRAEVKRAGGREGK
eukprot:78080-Rhodomonas_salina.1